ncbi:MAG: tRNA guanosine(34) transglycosylase Tgt [bacterium]
MKTIKTMHGDMRLPAFLPDATYGVVRGLDSHDLKSCGVAGLVVNAYHLMLHPGARSIQKMGGCHKFMSWDGPILSDSGGFQVFSLIHRNPKLGTIRENEIIFNVDGKKRKLTPEKCIQTQFHLGSDIMMCLDDCIHPEDSPEANRKSVERTIKWAEMCKKEFEKLTSQKFKGKGERPLLFAIVQGGNDRALRKLCAGELLKIGFDGYAFGGWPVDSDGNLLKGILEHTANLIPEDLPKYAMGVGKPEDVVACVEMGYNLFDCVIPTRDARHRRLYIFNAEREGDIDLSRGDFYEPLYIQDLKHIKDEGPISEVCDCFSCRNYSLSYIRHLFKVKETLAYRLATIHNLRFYMQLMERLEGKIDQNKPQWPGGG